MRICLIGKYPPIQGGVSARNFWIARWLAERGHEVHVVTNADEVEPGFRIRFLPGDEAWLAPTFEGGGSVRVWHTEPHGARTRHIPDHNPFATKLASLATAVIESSAADVVLAVYLEPYAVAGFLAAAFTGCPLILRHAGSDVGRLLAQPQLGGCYERILRRADLVCGSPSTLEQFATLGVPAERLHPDPGFAVPREIFDPAAEPLDINGLLARLADEAGEAAAGSYAPVDLDRPTIGVYGKIGPAKGSYDLVASLGELKRRGRRFNFLAMCGGDAQQVAALREAIARCGIEPETRLLPFLAHWRVPGFLRTLDCACFLENRFPIAAHGPGIPQEVLAMRVPLVMTVEIARKQAFAAALVHGWNALIVRDPRNHVELAAALEVALDDPEATAAVGRRGQECLPLADTAACVARYEAMLDRATARHGKVIASPSSGRAAAPCGDAPAWRHFPASRRVLERAAGRIDTGRGDADAYTQALQLCDGCADHWHQHIDALPQYTGELLRWELHHVPDPERAALADALLFRSAAVASCGSVSLAPNVMLRRFRHDMDALAEALAGAGDVPVRWPEQPCCYVFQHLPGRRRNRVFRVSASVYRFLESIDGDADLDELLEHATANVAVPGDDHPRSAVSRLLREGIVIASTAASQAASTPT